MKKIILAVFAALVIFVQTQSRAEDLNHFRISFSNVKTDSSSFLDNNGLLLTSSGIKINFYSNVLEKVMVAPVPEPSARMLLLPFGVLIWLLRLKRTV